MEVDTDIIVAFISFLVGSYIFIAKHIRVSTSIPKIQNKQNNKQNNKQTNK